MIGKLTGILDSVSTNAVIVDAGGVGYEVTIGARTFAALPPPGETVTLAIDTHAWFRALQEVQGVGAKIALAVLGTLSAADLANAVALQDKGQVARAPGVGPKVAARIVAELKDKMPALAPALRPGRGFAPIAVLPEGLAARDAVSALTNLGYAHGEAAAAITAAIGKAGREARAEDLIRLGLKELAS